MVSQPAAVRPAVPNAALPPTRPNALPPSLLSPPRPAPIKEPSPLPPSNLAAPPPSIRSRPPPLPNRFINISFKRPSPSIIHFSILEPNPFNLFPNRPMASFIFSLIPKPFFCIAFCSVITSY